jgi:flagellar biosynthesis protein FlhG
MRDGVNTHRFDQAAGLRQLVDHKPVRVIGVASGKGGVGKTSVAVNLATAMAVAGRKTLLLDADLGLANVDILLGLHTRFNLSHVLQGECSLADAVVEGPAGLQVIPAASGIKKMANLPVAEQAGLIHAFSELNQGLEAMIVDTAAGISDSVLVFARACQEVLVVVCDEPASITDAYALIKVLSRENGISHFRVLSNMVPSADAGRGLYGKLARVTDRFLNVTLDYAGAIPHDLCLRRAVQLQKSVVEAYPGSPSAQAFKKLVPAADKWPVRQVTRGDLQFFFERLIGAPGVVGVESPA